MGVFYEGRYICPSNCLFLMESTDDALSKVSMKVFFVV